jgi:hypothetical protein
LSTLETVATETPAAFATSLMVWMIPPSFFDNVIDYRNIIADEKGFSY